MSDDEDVKTAHVGFRATTKEKDRVERLADAFTSGDQSTLLRQLTLAAEHAFNKHGRDRTIWPPVLNFYPEEAKTQQDLDTGLHLERYKENE